MATTATLDQIYTLLYSDVSDPFSILGAHEIEHDGKKVISVRAYDPNVSGIYIIDEETKKEYKMEQVHKDGFFERIFLDRKKIFQYSFKKVYADGSELIVPDSYSFDPIISEEDLYLYNKGELHYAYNSLGAHVREIDGVKGVLFAVWAPTARRVSVVGDFNNWDGRKNMMRRRGSSGVWELFIPQLEEGEIYKYEIFTAKRQVIVKMDPFAFSTELVPNTASYVHDLEHYKWTDQQWMKERKNKKYGESPVSIYEVHLASWMKTEDGKMLSYRELAHNLADYVNEMGYTHVELLPIAEHPFGGSWGYQVTGYFSPTSRFGEPDDFMYFVDYLHQKGISVLLDWVPAHFPKDAHSLAWYDGTCLYEHADPRQGEHRDWGTLIFNFGRNEVKSFLISNALFWLDKYHIDGLRIDAVASMLYLDYSKKSGEWLPNKYGGKENIEAIEFISSLNSTIGRYFPEAMMIAEESTAWPRVSAPTHLGGLGFGYKWNMGWMNDMLRYMSQDPIYRKYHHNTLTFSILYAFSENFLLPLSHDEVVHGKGSLLGKMPGTQWEKFANLRLLYSYMFAHPGKKLLFQGDDIGQWSEWDHDESVDWHLLNYEPHYLLNNFMKDLLHLYKNSPSLYEVDFDYTGFEWLDFNDWENSIVSFMRKDKTGRKIMVCVFNFTPVIRRNYRIGVPYEGFYKEIFNSDAEGYGGVNVGNIGGVWADEWATHSKDYSISLSLPPLGAVFFNIELPEDEPEPVVQEDSKEEDTKEEAEQTAPIAPIADKVSASKQVLKKKSAKKSSDKTKKI